MSETSNPIRSICVYSASSTQIDEAYFAAADALGKRLAQRGIRLVNGAGNLGLMRACADACLQAGGEVTGVIPRFMVEQGWCHEHLTEVIETDDMHARKQRMADLSDGAIALPGGCGTLEELMEIITWKQLGLYLKPIVIYNVNGFFDPLLEQLRHCVEGHFMRPEHQAIWHVATSADEAIDLVRDTPLWDASVRKYAAI
jgi:uncharacterized protein (TIGR00730 family)